MLNNPDDAVTAVLERQLDQLNGEIAGLRAQQHLIMDLLVGRSKKVPLKVLNKQCWVELLRSAGMDAAAMDRWHQHFEALSPEANQSLLESLGIDLSEMRTCG